MNVEQTTADAPGPPPATPGWTYSFRALRHRDFRVFLTGQVVSLSGSWMQTLAESWLIYRLTHSTLLMGTLAFCTRIPVLLLGPVAGIVADRHSRRTLVILAQVALMLQASLLAWLTLTERITVTHLLILATVFGVITAFEIPARQSLFVFLVGKEDLPNAIALNSMTFNAARLIGPSFGGFFVAAFGEGLCFLINALTFLAVIVSLVVIHPAEPPRVISTSALARMREGFHYCWTTRQLRILLIATGLINLASAPIIVLAPVFADEIFHRGSFGLGLLTGAVGLGALLGTFVLARHSETSGLARVILVSAVQVAVCLSIFAWSPLFSLSMVAIAAVGFNIFRQLVATNSLIQTLIRDDYRGRVMAIYSMMVIGMLPIGNLISGWAAEHLGARGTVFAGALFALAAAAVWGREVAGERYRRSAA